MKNNLFIVKFHDEEVSENVEIEFSSLDHAKETYNTLKNQTGVNDLYIVEYDFSTKQYHYVTL